MVEGSLLADEPAEAEETTLVVKSSPADNVTPLESVEEGALDEMGATPVPESPLVVAGSLLE